MLFAPWCLDGERDRVFHNLNSQIMLHHTPLQTAKPLSQYRAFWPVFNLFSMVIRRNKAPRDFVLFGTIDREVFDLRIASNRGAFGRKNRIERFEAPL